MRTLGLVPARTGSKGVPGKNFRWLCGQPLWKWAYDIGVETCEFAVVSSDIVFAPNALKRPSSLAQDDTPMLDVARHAVEKLPHYDVVVLLQPTQPLRTVDHVRFALRLLEESGADSVVSVVEIPEHYRPEWAMLIDDQGGSLMFNRHDAARRRQDLPKWYTRDGTVYVTRADVIRAGSLYGDDCRALVIPPSESCNIDTEADWTRAEQMMRERNALRRAV